MSDRSSSERTLFATVFLLSQSWKDLLDGELAPAGLSAKQWLLLVAIETFGDDAPTLTETSERYGASRQATKQLAERLQRSGFLTVERDDRDARTMRLRLTAKHREFWEARAADHRDGLERLFRAVPTDDLATAAYVASALLATSRDERTRRRPEG